MRQKGFPNHLLHYHKQFSCVPGGALKKYPLWSDHTYHCGATLLGKFTRGLSDRVDILLPRQRALSQPIAFGLVVTNVTPNITCARAHPKSVTFPENFFRLEILRAYDQYTLGWIGVIPPVPGPGVSENQSRSHVFWTYLNIRHRQRTRDVWCQVSPVSDYC